MQLKDFKLKLLPFKSKMYRFAKGMLNDKEDAEDIVQEVYLKLWSIRFRLNRLNNIEAFAMQMIKNRCLNALKSKRNKTNFTVEENIFDTEITPERKMELVHASDLIGKIIDTLPEQQKTIILLRDIEAYSFNEIAEITGLTANNIRVNLSRTRKKVRQTYLKVYGDG